MEIIEQYYNQERSIILYTAHYGNWEWLIFLPLLIPVNYKTQTIYQKLSNGYFNDFMLLLRSRFGVECVESAQSYKKLATLKREKRLNVTCVIGDQSPRADASKHWVKFLDQDTAFLVGTERIASKLDSVVLFTSYKKISRGKYEVTFIPIEENPAESTEGTIIEKYANQLEAAITNEPELWLWSHKRWKLQKRNSGSREASTTKSRPIQPLNNQQNEQLHLRRDQISF